MDVHRAFEGLKPDLVRRFPGQFAVVCGGRLMGVYETIDDAVLAVSRAFDDRTLPEGAPVLISELAEPVTVRVTAQAYPLTLAAAASSSSG